MWKVVKTKVGKIRVGKTKRRRKERGGGEKTREERAEKKEKKKPKKKRMMEVKKVAEGWKIWDEKEKVAKLKEVKKLVSERFHKWIHVFGEKASERMPIRKLWDHTIDIKKEFVLRKEKVYPLSREEREEACKFISEQLKKRVY